MKTLKNIIGWFLALFPVWGFIVWGLFFAMTELIFCIIIMSVILIVIYIMRKGIRIIKQLDEDSSYNNH